MLKQHASIVTDINECELNNCDMNALCEDTEGGFDCICNDGYSGNGTFCSKFLQPTICSALPRLLEKSLITSCSTMQPKCHALLCNSVYYEFDVPYISELKQGTNRSLVSFTSLVISSDNVNRGLVLLLLLCLIYKPGHN